MLFKKVWGTLGTWASGLLSPTSGGTGLSSVAQGDLIYGSATNVWSNLVKSATATRYLSNTGTSNNPAWAQVNLTNGVTGTLPIANGGTGSTTQISFVEVDSARAITTAEMCGQILKINGAYAPTLPTAAVGLNCVAEATTAAIFSLDLATGTDVIELSATALMAGNKITSSGAKRASVWIYCETVGTYIAQPLNDVFIDGGA